MSENEENPEETETNAKTEEEQLTDFAASALRGPKFGIFEQLICQHLVQATVTADSLRKIQLVCDAALMLEPDKQKALGVDMEKLEIVKAVNDAFQRRVATSLKQYARPIVSVEFGFPDSEENYTKYVGPWWTGEMPNIYATQMNNRLGKIYTVYRCTQCRNRVADSIKGRTGYTEDKCCKFCGADLHYSAMTNPQPLYINHNFKPQEDAPYWELFFEYCFALKEDGYINLKNHFLKWANPFAMDLMRRLTHAVRPEIYNEIARMFVKAKGESQT